MKKEKERERKVWWCPSLYFFLFFSLLEWRGFTCLKFGEDLDAGAEAERLGLRLKVDLEARRRHNAADAKLLGLRPNRLAHAERGGANEGEKKEKKRRWGGRYVTGSGQAKEKQSSRLLTSMYASGSRNSSSVGWKTGASGISANAMAACRHLGNQKKKKKKKKTKGWRSFTVMQPFGEWNHRVIVPCAFLSC